MKQDKPFDYEAQLPKAEQSQAHYSVPEDYFEDLERNIMARIDAVQGDAEAAPPTPPVGLWTKVKPSLYLAATFVSIYLGFKLIAPETSSPEQPRPVASAYDVSDEEYIQYYESYALEVETIAQEQVLAQLQDL